MSENTPHEQVEMQNTESLAENLDSHLKSVGATTKKEIVKHGYDFLWRTKLTESEILTILADKINVRSPKAVKYYPRPETEQERVQSVHPVRPPIIPDSKFFQLKNWLTSEYEAARYVTIEDIMNYIFSGGGLEDIDQNKLQHNLKEACFRPVKAKPQEPGRINLTSSQIQDHFRLLSNIISDVPARMIINADESGFHPVILAKMFKCL